MGCYDLDDLPDVLSAMAGPAAGPAVVNYGPAGHYDPAAGPSAGPSATDDVFGVDDYTEVFHEVFGFASAAEGMGGYDLDDLPDVLSAMAGPAVEDHGSVAMDYCPAAYPMQPTGSFA